MWRRSAAYIVLMSFAHVRNAHAHMMMFHVRTGVNELHL